MVRLADLRPEIVDQPQGCRVVIDLRPLQEPERSPITAAYLERLIGAYADAPLPGEQLVAVLRVRRPDPLPVFVERGLDVAGRRWMPPTGRMLRTAGLTLDALLLRGASLRTGPGHDDAPGHGALFHTAGGATPVAFGLPVVATLLDLAPWELPERYARTAAARLGHRVRRRSFTTARQVLVGSRATAEAAIRLLGLSETQLVVVPLAADAAFQAGGDADALRLIRATYGIPERYLVVGGRYDARSDLPTVLAALAGLRQSPANAAATGNRKPVGRGATAGMGATTGKGAASGRGSHADADWPPVLVLAGAAGTDDARTRVTALAEHHGVRDLLRLTPPLSRSEVAALEAGAVGHVQPALSDSTGLAALDALAAGVPVIASRTGALPEIVGPSGIIVEPRDPARMATALRALWTEGAVASQVTRAARVRAEGTRRTWEDVARETRWAYQAALEANAVG